MREIPQSEGTTPKEEAEIYSRMSLGSTWGRESPGVSSFSNKGTSHTGPGPIPTVSFNPKRQWEAEHSEAKPMEKGWGKEMWQWDGERAALLQPVLRWRKCPWNSECRPAFAWVVGSNLYFPKGCCLLARPRGSHSWSPTGNKLIIHNHPTGESAGKHRQSIRLPRTSGNKIIG